jgi:hypothetical protein
MSRLQKSKIPAHQQSGLCISPLSRAKKFLSSVAVPWHKGLYKTQAGCVLMQPRRERQRGAFIFLMMA